VFAPLATGIFLSPALFPVSGAPIKDGAMTKISRKWFAEDLTNPKKF